MPEHELKRQTFGQYPYYCITGRVVTPRKLTVSKGSKGYEGGIKENEASVTSIEK